jgi:hypothetical protein
MTVSFIVAWFLPLSLFFFIHMDNVVSGVSRKKVCTLIWHGTTQSH